MKFKEEVTIEGSKEEVWSVISDIENSPSTISGIEKIEILDKPDGGLVGLKWKETRTLFGREATEIMWITDAKENEYYRTRAENQGAVYITRLAVSEEGKNTRLVMEFDGVPQTFGARFMSAIMGMFFKGATRNALIQDLMDIKTAVEGRK